jgi:hypothetical protein
MKFSSYSVYNDLYNAVKSVLVQKGYSDDESSRTANKLAVIHTWDIFNDLLKNEGRTSSLMSFIISTVMREMPIKK